MNPSARRALLDHYDLAKRDLPWRGERDPYRVLVSEVMLQQTRVDTVKRYYEAWLGRFPDLDALAEADTEAVLKAWEGLGYYRRARNLHAAAKVIRERSNGWPTTLEGLRELPGVGAYTAGAVASIAFDEAVPAVDGNVRRVLARIYDEPDPTDGWLRARASELVDQSRPGDWNQALMELGATVCTLRDPSCPECPVAEWCAARAAGTVSERPAPKRRGAAREETWVLAVMRNRGRVLLQRRPDDGLLAGMWAFPEVRLPADAGPERGSEASVEVLEAARGLARSLGTSPYGSPRLLQPVDHVFSHIRARYLPVELLVGSRAQGRRMKWVDPARPGDVAVPVAQQKVLAQLVEAA